LENWYAKIGQDQNTTLLPKLDKLVTVQLHVMGKYTDDYLIKFHPLSVPSKKDTAETDYKRAQTFEILNNIGALDASEVRKMLPDEGYDIESPDELPEGPVTAEEAAKETADLAAQTALAKAAPNGTEKDVQQP